MTDFDFYSHRILQHDGFEIDLSTFRDKVVIIVNVAILCGYAPQFHELQQLHSKYYGKGLRIIAVPCNQFGKQQPLSDEETVKICREKYGVTFPVSKKMVVNGPDEDSLYTGLKNAKPGALGFKGVRWNFEKFIIDRCGKVAYRFASRVEPLEFEHIIVHQLNHHM